MRYNKPPLTIAQQLQKFKDRGLIINDEDRAKKYLSFISYYRLRAYTYPYQKNDSKIQPFEGDTTFDMILDTYLLDSIIPTHHFRDKFKELLEKYPVISETKMGFPDNWKNEPLWQ